MSRSLSVMLVCGLTLLLSRQEASTKLREEPAPPGKPSGAKPSEQRPEPKAPGKGTSGRHALLVGATEYPNLPRHLWLEGGANDVLLMEELLRNYYDFPKENILILSEAEGKKDAKRLPTRANIKRECDRLAKVARAGDKVVVLLSGHGSRQPNKAGDDLEQIFLPRDVSEWNFGGDAVPNAIAGRELGDWLRPIPTRKASLWVVLDACHSGDAVRGASEKVRQVDLVRDLKVPKKAVADAGTRGPKAKGKVGGETGPLRLAQLDGVVLTYACQANEVTIERLFPAEGADSRPYGLLTYTLNGILRSSSEPLTYREVVLRAQNEYTALGRCFPTPVLAGKDQNSVVFGSETVRRPAILVREKGEALLVNAGQLHGLTPGTILAVHPPFGVKGKLRGHVRVTKVRAAQSEVVPCTYEKVAAPAAKDLPGGRCEVVEVDFGDMKLKVAVDRLGSKPKDAADMAEAKRLKGDLDRLAKDLEGLAREAGSPIALVACSEAEWLVRLDGGKAYLLRSAESEDERSKGERLRLGPATVDAKLPSWLKSACTRIVRAENLVKLAAKSTGELVRSNPDFQAKVEVEIVRVGAKAGGMTNDVVRSFYKGDEVQYRIKNTGKVAVDVTLLYVDSGFGIEALFPDAEPNRVHPGKTLTVPSVEIDTKTMGREQVVVIAVKAEGVEPVDFVSLAQPALASAQDTARKRGVEKSRGLASPFGLLLQNARYGEGARAASRKVIENYAMTLVPVQVRPGERPAEAK